MYIPQDLVIGILVNLPLESLARFRYVSKTWLSIISRTHFVKSNLKSANRVFSLCKHTESVSRIPVLIPNIHREKPVEILKLCRDSRVGWRYPVDIVGTCNGLVCVRENGVLMLWNPLTKESHKLPSSRSNNRDIWKVQHGFGYDASNDDYKVVESSWIEEEGNLHSVQKIYSLRLNSWKLLDSNAFAKRARSGVFLKGAIHWQVALPGYRFNNYDIIAINLTSEASIVMEPPDGGDPCDIEELGASEEHLYLSYSYEEYTDYWMMREYGIKESWTKIMRLPELVSLMERLDNIDFEVRDNDRLRSYYKSNECTVENVCQFDEIPSTQDYIKFETLTYSETLVSVSPGCLSA